MTQEKQRRDAFVRVKDAAGNDWLCPIDALKNLKEASEEELEYCVDDAIVGRYGGDIDIVN